jgi:hypothetical protein
MEKEKPLVAIRLSKEELRSLKLYCIEHETSMQQFVKELIVETLKLEEALE